MAKPSSVPPTNSNGANAVATATGGASFNGAGGAATADAAATGDPGDPEFAAAGASATGGSGTTGLGAANATALATGLQGSGASVAANATADAVGSSGTAAATAQNSGAGIDGVIASATAPAQVGTAAAGTAFASASVGTFNNYFLDPGQTGNGEQPDNALAYSFATAAPQTSQLRFFDPSIGTNVTQYLLQPGGVLAGAAILGTNYDAADTSGAQHTYTASATFNPAAATGDTLLLGLANYQEYGFDLAPTTFQSIELKATEGPTVVFDESFTSLAAAETFFTDDTVNLGVANGAAVDVQLSVTGSGAGGFAADMLVGTGSSAPAPTVCFAQGTRIRTLRGDVAVECLEHGDHVVTASGGIRSIRWLGHRAVDCRGDPGACPIRIAAHAFGPNHPARDLWLSPGHPVLVGAGEESEDGMLVPIMCLVNGSTVRRETVESVTYWHVELDRHDILLAEGLPAESYIDLGSRPWFAGAASALYDPDMVFPGMPGRCRPVAVDGPIVEVERRRLDIVFATRLGAACAWPNGDTPTFDWEINGFRP